MNNLDFLRRVALYVGVVGLIVAALMTFKFGSSMSVLHAVGLCLLTVAGSIIWPVIKHTWDARSFQTWAMVVAGVLFLGVEYFSHLGYTVGTRVGETQQTSVHNAKFDDTRASLESDRVNIDLWKKQLSELTALAPWAATVTADGMRGELEAIEKAVELEANRGGCKSKCQALMAKKGTLQTKIGTIEQASDLNKRIEATQRIIDGKTKVASEATFESSPVVNQTNFVAQLWTAQLKPDEMSLTWTQIIIGAIIALVTTFLAPIMLNIALGPEKDAGRAMTKTQSDIEDVYRTFKAHAHDAAKSAAGNVNATFITAKDDMARDIAEILSRAGAQLKAA
jgi:hypothetical protein